MPRKKIKTNKVDRARSLRRTQTKSEALLWAVLRARQLCGLKFRRQHPIGPFFADFACVEEALVIEIDGGYHDLTGERDLDREAFIRKNGWRILRFTDEDVENDVEKIALGIAAALGRNYEFTPRGGRTCASGIRHASTDSTLPNRARPAGSNTLPPTTLLHPAPNSSNTLPPGGSDVSAAGEGKPDRP